MKKGRKMLRGCLIVVLLLCAVLGAEVIRSNFCLTTDFYQVRTEKVDAPLRIVQLSDLHNAEFGAGNSALIAEVATQVPDLILFTGDLVTSTVEGTEIAEALLEKLVEIAPVYVSVGNHERQYEKRFGTDLTAVFERAGAVMLEYEYADIEVRGQKLRIGGASGYCVPEIFLSSGEAKEHECAFLHEMADTDGCTVLMCHMPMSWIRNDAISAWDIDLVFAGHAHGGQWVIPFLGPVYAPDMGYFPERVEGLFPSGDGAKTLVVSSGLGSSVAIPRLNNPPQILVLDILPK